MNALAFLISTVLNLFLMIVLLRLAMQWARADFYNPFSQFVVKATQPVLKPMRRVLPSIGSLDLAAVVLALLVATSKLLLLTFIYGQDVNPLILSYLGVLTVVKEAGILLFWLLLLRAILSWVSQGHNPFELVLIQLTEPLLSPIRRILPPMGGLDLSMVVILVLMNFINILFGDMVPGWQQI